MENRLITQRIYFAAIVVACGCVVVWLWVVGFTVARGVWCGYGGCHLSFFGLRFLHIGTYRLPPSAMFVTTVSIASCRFFNASKRLSAIYVIASEIECN